MRHYKPRENIQSTQWPDVFGPGARKVNAGRCCVLDYWGTGKNSVHFKASF